MSLESRGTVQGKAGLKQSRFIAVSTLEDSMAVRCGDFHPDGNFFAIGSNSKSLHICRTPDMTTISRTQHYAPPTVLARYPKHHKGSIYCLSWAPVGSLLATGSNDKTIKIIKVTEEEEPGHTVESVLPIHDGTVRDLCFLSGAGNPHLVSGGAGDCQVYVTDCTTSSVVQVKTGHSEHILSVFSWGEGSPIFVSGSQDKTIRFWDTRTKGCVQMVSYESRQQQGSLDLLSGSPVSSCCVDPSGRLLVSGHEDASCTLYDIRGHRFLQSFSVHSSDVRSVRLSPSSFYLLSTSYDRTVVLTDLQGNLTNPLPSLEVASHRDKVITGRWHPQQCSFLSTSADKTSTVWAIPDG